MHFLDLIMFFALFFLLWGALDAMSDGEFTNEMGGVFIGAPVMIIYCIAYIVLFAWVDYNWVDLMPEDWKWVKW